MSLGIGAGVQVQQAGIWGRSLSEADVQTLTTADSVAAIELQQGLAGATAGGVAAGQGGALTLLLARRRG